MHAVARFRTQLLPLVALSLAAFAGCARSTQGTATGAAPAGGAYDVVIEGGRIVDGTGNAWFHGDLGIRGDRIATITPAGMLRSASAARRIDAKGLVVAPGFIDIQGHSRGAFLSGDARVVSKVMMGVTTEIMGEGATNAPANALTGGGGVDPNERRTESPFAGPRGFDKWLRAMEARGPSVNLGSFVGATTVRMYAKGMTEGAAKGAELDSMRFVVREAMKDGAFGIASALIYPPGVYAGTEELVEIAKAMSPYGGVYITHMRSEADAFLEAIDEALRIGREGGVAVEIYHLKAAGKRNWHKASQAIAKIDSARAAGQDVSADMYPYVAGGTGLSACLPPWAAAEGKLLERLQDPAMRAKMKEEVLRERTEWENLCQLATPEGVMVLGLRTPQYAQYAGKSLAAISQAVGKDWSDTMMDIIIAERDRVGAMYFLMSEENLSLQIKQPWIKFGTDASGMDPDSARGGTHPRAYGTFTRVLGHFVRERKDIALEDAVRKMSSAVATRLSIHDRGVLRPGLYADVVVFDPATVADLATYDKPHQNSVGVKHVLVNGVSVVTDGKHTNARPGKIVRGPGWTGPGK